ncbi:MAG: transporter [Planctomycetes bacterium]|nr:transporter [Planctomycetota bacterium]
MWFAFFPTGVIVAVVGPQQYLDGGFTLRVTPNIQFEIRAGVGLNRQSDDFFAGTGFAVRY